MAKWLWWWLGCCLALTAGAAERPVQPLSLSLESFLWEEFLDGERLLYERGARLAAGVEQENLARAWPGLVFLAQARFYGGRVAYQGRSQSADGTTYPLASHTDYLGGGARLLMGQRLGYLSEGPALDLYLGADFGLWLRSIAGGVDAGGRAASGYQELYRQWMLLAGVGLARPDPYRSWLGAGLSLPVWVREWVSLAGQELRPRGAPGFWVNLRMRLSPRTSLALEAAVERWRASPVAGGVFQPDSRSQRLSMGLVWAL